MEEPVIVDTCIWASFFSKPGSSEKFAVDALIDFDRVALVGPIIGEVLLGFRRKLQADWAYSRLRRAHFFEVSLRDWKNAAEMGRDLAAKGSKLPLTDLVVAAVALRSEAWVYTTDPHFELFPDLKRYAPD